METPPPELTPEQIEKLTADLRALEASLSELSESVENSAKPVDLDEPIGRLSRMDAMQQQKMAEANRRSHQLRLRAVKVALEAIADGTYGWCRSCDEAIGFRRLEAKPEVAICVRCQAEQERA